MRAAAYLSAAHLLAALAALSLPDYARWVVVAGVLVSLYAGVAPLVRPGILGFDALALGADGAIRGCNPKGDTRPLELRSFRILSPACVVVSLRSVAKRRRIALMFLAGDHGEDALRQLRLWLLWQSDRGRAS